MLNWCHANMFVRHAGQRNSVIHLHCSWWLSRSRQSRMFFSSMEMVVRPCCWLHRCSAPALCVCTVSMAATVSLSSRRPLACTSAALSKSEITLKADIHLINACCSWPITFIFSFIRTKKASQERSNKQTWQKDDTFKAINQRFTLTVKDMETQAEEAAPWCGKAELWALENGPSAFACCRKQTHTEPSVLHTHS